MTAATRMRRARSHTANGSRSWARRVVGLLATTLLCAGAAHGQPASIGFNAFSVWYADAQGFRTGATTGTVIGTLRGPLFVETDQGPVRAGELLCPATVTVDLESLRQVGAGRCTFTAKDGALAFGSFVCAGYHLVGCTGDFVLDGGTERLEGVTGSGPITIRGDGWLIATDGSGEAAESAVGITVLRDFRLTAKP